ncbi:MAG: MFS transporter [Methanobacteriota archaeon]|nr:MAG: MFS transporter [Euryarchaeota archaeon]
MAAPTLWRHPNFLKLWIGQSVSQFGNQFTGLALQFLALKTLLASPSQMGLLGAMGTFPFLLIGLLVGVWVDRHRRRPILIAGDLGRGFIVVAIATLTLLGIVRMEYLYVLGFATGILTVFFDVSYQAYLPALVPRGQIVEGNSKLEATNTTAQVTGPVLAGFALKAVGYAFAMVADGLTFFFSAGLMARIRTPEAVPATSERRAVTTEIREGLHVVFRDRRLWSIAGCTGTANLFSGALFALFTLYAVRVLGLDEVGIGTIGGIGGIGGILGAVTANRLANRIGIGRAIVVGILAGSLSSFGVVLATPQFAFVFLTAMVFVGALGTLWYNINQVSLRQSLVPVRIQGRLNATMRFLVWGTIPIGSLLGGALGEVIGVYPAIVLAAVGGLLAAPWVFFSPVRSLKTIPPPTSD